MKTRRSGPYKLLSPLLLAACLLTSVGLPSIVAGQAGFVGSEQCKDCHATESATHVKSVHSRAWEGKGYGCESCHGPAGDHVTNPSLSNIISFGKKSKQSSDEQSKACLECHSTSTQLSFWDNGQHKRDDVACAACHEIHTNGKSIAKDPDVCLECHKDIRSQVNNFSHHPIVEGKVKCSSCHNPHGAMSKAMIKEDSVNQLCYKCHSDKRGPYVWEHPPVAENCLICHSPHGTKSGRLLNEKMPSLCENCHADSGHHSTAYGSNFGFNGANKQAQFYGRSCLNCHGSIHGSNAPSAGGAAGGNLFTR